MSTTQAPPDPPKAAAEHNENEAQRRRAPGPLEATGTKPVDAPDLMAEPGEPAPQVVVNPEFDPADNRVKLMERNVDPPAHDGYGADDKERERNRNAGSPKDAETAREAAKRAADASLVGAGAAYGGRSGQIAAYLRSFNVPVLAAEDVGDTAVRITVEPKGGGAPLVYEAKESEATPEFFLGRMRLAGFAI